MVKISVHLQKLSQN